MAHLVDIFEVARRGTRVEGTLKPAELPELSKLLANEEGRLSYAAEGEGDRRGHPAARLSIEGEVFLTCTHCGKPVAVRLESEAVFLLAKSEEEANAMPIEEDAEDEDVVVGSKRFNLAGWAEEEAILTLPSAARHDACDEAEWAQTPDDEPEAPKRPNPFAALAALKTKK